MTEIVDPPREPTGTCVAHREPLYDGEEMCATCWDEYEAAMCAEDSEKSIDLV